MKSMHYLMHILVIVGALNWGLVSVGNWMGSNWNVVNLLLGTWPTVENVVYLLVGLSALSLLFTMKKDCRECSSGTPGMM